MNHYESGYSMEIGLYKIIQNDAVTQNIFLKGKIVHF